MSAPRGGTPAWGGFPRAPRGAPHARPGQRTAWAEAPRSLCTRRIDNKASRTYCFDALKTTEASLPARPGWSWVRRHAAPLACFIFSIGCYAGVLVVGRGGSGDSGLLAGLLTLTVLSAVLIPFQGHHLVVGTLILLKVMVALLIGIPMELADGREELLFYAIIADCLLHLQ